MMLLRLDEPITIKLLPREDGGLRVCSDDLPGLILSGSDPAKVMRDILPAVITLRGYTRPFVLDTPKDK